MAERGGPAARRWRLVRARLAEMERLVPGRGSVGVAFWDARARRFAAAVADRGGTDPLVARARRAAGRRGSVLDVGAGPGRLALVLAPRVAQVTAVDPSPRMLAILRREARRRELTNVRAVEGAWEDVEVAPADVGICAYVLPMIADAAGFVARLGAFTRRRAFAELNAAGADVLVEPLWRHFHGAPRRPAPTYLDLVAILAEQGVVAEVEVVEVPVRTRFADLGAAVGSYRETLLLPRTAAALRELSGLLAAWLVRTGDGALRPPLRTTPVAIVSWAGRAGVSSGGPSGRSFGPAPP
ncbi:MAG: class I SAM-dependent methyltransferase [Acidimicrobiales bacterium]